MVQQSTRGSNGRSAQTVVDKAGMEILSMVHYPVPQREMDAFLMSHESW